MKKGTFMLLTVMVGVLSLFVATGIYAGTEVKDVIELQNEKGLVVFSHQKHTTDYGAGCGECHHDAEGKPLADLKPGDDVKHCKDCHQKPGEVPKEVKQEWRDKKIKKAEQNKLELEWAAEAYHANCQGCHKDYNKKNKTKAAPTTCTGCHAKSE